MTFTPLGHDALIGRLATTWSAESGPHGWILTGPQGIGKGAAARHAIARVLDIPAGGAHPDFITLEPSEHETKTLSITVDDVRNLSRQLRLTPARGGRRVALIDPADEMTPSAANALLKILEEPPATGLLVLVTHALGAIPETVRSRCAIERCAPPAANVGISILRGALDVDEQTAGRLLALADGSPGQAMALATSEAGSLYERLIALLTRPQPFERSGLQGYAYEAARLWPLPGRLIMTLLHRAMSKASGLPVPAALFPDEAALVAKLSAFGPAALATAWDLVGKVMRDTETAKLDQKYATVRLLLALDFAFKADPAARELVRERGHDAVPPKSTSRAARAR